jgi:hypothetical protein
VEGALFDELAARLSGARGKHSECCAANEAAGVLVEVSLEQLTLGSRHSGAELNLMKATTDGVDKAGVNLAGCVDRLPTNGEGARLRPRSGEALDGDERLFG